LYYTLLYLGVFLAAQFFVACILSAVMRSLFSTTVWKQTYWNRCVHSVPCCWESSQRKRLCEPSNNNNISFMRHNVVLYRILPALSE